MEFQQKRCRGWKQRALGLGLIGLVVFLQAVGCGGRSAEFESTSPEQARFVAVWRASQDVLRDYRFELDIVDARSGVIQTDPMVGRSWFECWRSDAATCHAGAESSLQTIYRKAIVSVTPGESDDFLVDVRVQVSRSDNPEPQVTSTSEAYGLFLRRGRRERRDEAGFPVRTPLPDDEALAGRIERDIERRAAGLQR